MYHIWLGECFRFGEVEGVGDSEGRWIDFDDGATGRIPYCLVCPWIWITRPKKFVAHGVQNSQMAKTELRRQSPW